MEALQGLLTDMEEAGTRTICMGAHCTREAVRAGDDAVPGGTTRLAKVESNAALEASSPGLDVVLSEPNISKPCLTQLFMHCRAC